MSSDSRVQHLQLDTKSSQPTHCYSSVGGGGGGG